VKRPILLYFQIAFLVNVVYVLSAVFTNAWTTDVSSSLLARIVNAVFFPQAIVFWNFLQNDNFARNMVVIPHTLAVLATVPVSFIYAAIIFAVMDIFRPGSNRNSTKGHDTNIVVSVIRSIGNVAIALVLVGVILWVLLPSPDSYTIKARVQDGISFSSPARTALDVVCSEEGELRPGLRQNGPELGLSAPEIYNGRYIKSVTVSVPEQNVGKVVVAYKQIEYYIENGATVIYRGECGTTGTRWSVDPASTVPKKFWPKPW